MLMMLMMLMIITNVINRQRTMHSGLVGGLWWSVLLHSSLCATPSVRREPYKVK